jgi:uncharacterized protein YegL
MLRRLPVYLLLDTSESMVGKPIKQLQEGVGFMLKELKRNPYALETVWLSIITFADKATMALPLTELTSVKIPDLSVRPGTALGEALSMVRKSVDKDVVRNSKEKKGDYKPLIFILTDGEPTDDWKRPLVYLTDLNPLPIIISVGCGDEADLEVLTSISPSAISISDLNTDALGKFFVWLSSSVGAQSHAVSSDKPVDLLKRPLPQGVDLVKSDEIHRSPKRPRVFLHVRCRKSKEPYILIYKFNDLLGTYVCQDSQPLPQDFFSGGVAKQPPLDSEMLMGSSPCPHCGSVGWFRCGKCGNLACWDDEETSPFLICPHCGTKGSRPQVMAFTVEGSSG